MGQINSSHQLEQKKKQNDLQGIVPEDCITSKQEIPSSISQNTTQQLIKSTETLADEKEASYQPRNPSIILDTRNEDVITSDIPETKRKFEKIAEFSSVCSQITEFLYVSGSKVACERDIIAHYRITYIVNCAYDIIPNTFENDIDLKVEYSGLRLRDGVGEDLLPFFLQIIDIIEKVRHKNERILIHCQQGVSRSCSFIIAYLIWWKKISYYEAFNETKRFRGVCSPNSAFICQLLEFEALLRSSSSDKEASATYIYRFAPHAFYDPETKILKPCYTLNTRKWAQLDKKYFHSKTSLVVKKSKTIFVWIGSESNLESKDNLNEHVKYLQNYIFKNVQNIKYIEEGNETDEFKQMFPQGDFFISKETKNYPYAEEYTWNLFVAKTVLVEDESNNLITNHSDLAPKLYQFIQDGEGEEMWESITDYEPDDLESHACFLLVNINDVSQCYLWKGKDLDIDDNTLIEKAQAKLQRKLQKILLQYQHEEDDAFWMLYEAGY